MTTAYSTAIAAPHHQQHSRSTGKLLICLFFLASLLVSVITLLTSNNLIFQSRDSDSIAVETESFGYEKEKLLPNTTHVVDSLSNKQEDNSNSSFRRPASSITANYKTDNSSSPRPPPASSITTTKTANSSGMVVDQDYLAYLQTLDPIPKKIHVFFTPDKKFVEHASELEIMRHGVLNLIQQNPDWELIVYDDQDIQNIIQKDAASLLSQEERQVLKGAHIVEVTDVARLVVMYTQGGLYVDVDQVMNIPLAEVLKDTTRLCMPTYFDINFMCDIMCSAPKNELFRNTIAKQSQVRMSRERRGGWLSASSQLLLTPGIWNKVLVKTVFGRDKEIRTEEFESARTAIRATGGVIVTEKNQWCDGFLVKPFEGCKRVSRGPLYDMYNITPWVPQVDAIWKKDKVAV